MIREAHDHDAKAIRDLLFDIWLNEYQFSVKEEDFPDLHAIDAYYHKKGGTFFVALEDEQVIGTIACEKLGAHHFVLKRMFLRKEFRGRGIAQLLLDALFKKMVFSSHNHNVLFFLSTKEDQAIAAKKFYLKNGFRVISKSDVPPNFPFFYEDDLYMVKDRWGA